MLKQYSAIIDMNRSKLFLKINQIEWTADIVDSDSMTPTRVTYHIQRSLDQREQSQSNKIFYELDDEQLWHDKINEIRNFKCGITDVQREQLIEVYNRYPVSYTHLDVYKRQVYNSLCGRYSDNFDQLE